MALRLLIRERHKRRNYYPYDQRRRRIDNHVGRAGIRLSPESYRNLKFQPVPYQITVLERSLSWRVRVVFSAVHGQPLGYVGEKNERSQYE